MPSLIMKFVLVLTVVALVAAHRDFQLDANVPYEAGVCSAGETVSFHVPSNPTTGFNWYIVPTNSIVAQPLNGFTGDFHPSGSGLIGAGGEQEFILQCWTQAKPSNTYEFRLEKRRGFEPDPAKVKLVTLTVQ